jgi:hypothetical protein
MNATQTLPHPAPTRDSVWPYALIGWFVIFVSAIAAFITWAVGQNVDLVRSDYYDSEIRYQEQINRLNRTTPLQAATRVEFDYAGQQVRVVLPREHVTAAGTIHLYRPSNARLDRHLPLALGADGAQTLDARSLESGLWKVGVLWKVGSEEFYFEKPLVIGRD